MNSLVYFFLSVLSVAPVLFCLDPVTPFLFLGLSGIWLGLKNPRRLGLWLGTLGGAAVLAWWVYWSNYFWTVGVDPMTRALVLAVRAGCLTGMSAAFALGIRPSDLLNEAMQILGLSPRVGYALQTALNLLPRLREEQKTVDAVHRVRNEGRKSGPIVQSVTLLASAIRTGERAAQSLAVRGLESPGPRTWYRPSRWTVVHSLWLALGVLCTIGILVTSATFGWLHFGFY